MSVDSSSEVWSKSLGIDRKQFSMFSENMLDGFAYHKIVVDAKGQPVDYVFLEVNKAFEKMTGLQRENIIGRKVTEVLVGIENDLSDWIGTYGRVALTCQSVQFENSAQPLGKWFRVLAYCPEKGYFITIFEDITARKKAEEAILKEKEQAQLAKKRLETILEATPSAVVILEAPNGRFSFANKRALQLYGFETLGLDLEENVAKVKARRADGTVYPIEEMPVSRSLTTGEEVHNVEMVIERPDGKAFPIMASTAPLRDKDGNITAAIVVWEDISERKKAEEELRESNEALLRTHRKLEAKAAEVEEYASRMEEIAQERSRHADELMEVQQKLEVKAAEVEEYASRMEELVEERTNSVRRQAALIDLSPDAIIVRGLDGRISFWSKGAENLYGWRSEEAIGQVASVLLNTAFPEALSDISDKVKTTGSWSGELQHTTKDGHEVCVQSSWLAEKDNKGKIKGFLETNVDITQRKKAEEAVQSERQRLFDVLETLPVMVCLITPDYHIAFANRSFRERFGDSKGRPCYEYCWGQSEPCKFCESLTPLKTGKPHRWEVTGPDGSSIEAYDYPFTDIDGSQLVLEMDIDVTARKKAEVQAVESARKLKDSERLAAIGTTAGMVGHDIRNPLQSITGDVFLIKSELDNLPDGETKKNILESLDETENNLDYINKIVQDLQDFARPLNPKTEESDIKDIAEKLITKMDLPKNVRVSVKVANDARKINADSYYLNRILANLITNAAQAMTNGGKLTLITQKKGAAIILIIKDTGVGIPDNIQSKMFTVMFTTKSKGQGFGLPVVKRMTESLGGTVSFESQEGKGTTFTITLPIKEKKKASYN